jgi:hypothetical protein
MDNMNKYVGLILMLAAGYANAADYPAASEQFRAEYATKYGPACVAGIEAVPDLRAFYSHKTVEGYCACRQKYEADVIADANNNDKRGKEVQDGAAAYAEEKCMHVLMNQQ